MSGQLATDANRASSSDSPRIAPAALAAFVKRALEAAGLSSEDAEIVAGLMVEADLRGSDTHGVIRLPLYLRRFKAGGIKARADIRIVQERPATAVVDGDNGMGHLVMRANMLSVKILEQTIIFQRDKRLLSWPSSHHTERVALCT